MFSSVQLMLSWWRNLISCRVDYQCLVLTNIVASVGVIHTRGQYIRSHSTGEDFISLIVTVFLNRQLKAVWLKFGVLDFRRKRLRGVGPPSHSSKTIKVLVYLDILWKGLYSVIIVFSSDQFIVWLDISFASIFGSVRILDLRFGAGEKKDILTTSRFADSHRVTIALHATGCVSLYVNL